MGPISDNAEDGGSRTYLVSETNNCKVVTVEFQQDVVYIKVRGSAGSGWNSVVNKLHWKKTGVGGTVDGTADDIRCMCKGDRILGYRDQEGTMLEPIGARDTAQGNLGGNITGIQEYMAGKE